MDIFDQVVKAGTILQEMKADNIIVIDYTKQNNMAKYFVVATADSNVHGRACANKVEVTLQELGVEAYSKESGAQTDWAIVDYYDFVIHIMTKEVREHYNIDKLWSDGKNTKKLETVQKDLLAAQKRKEKVEAKTVKKQERTAKKQEKTVKKQETKKPKKAVKKEKVTKEK